MSATTIDEVVRARYSDAARVREASLCCPVEYDPSYLAAIPEEVIERDYGCGDPTRYVRKGDVVLDLGSGSGKICFIASQIVGPEGRVIGVDANEEMLGLARRAAPVVADRSGFSNVEFRRGRIQDLALDLDRVDACLAEHPVTSSGDVARLEATMTSLRERAPLIPSESVDVVISNCVLNLVWEEHKESLIREIYRVVRRGGRIAISDIVSDEPIPRHLKEDPELWSGCVSGAFEERELLRHLEEAGFYGIAVDKWESQPFAVVEGIEFRAVTVTALKGKEGPCLEANQAVIYRGPWSRVEDDDGHVLVRGERTAVCAKTYAILTRDPYGPDLIAIEPRRPVPAEDRGVFDCSRATRRDPRETKGHGYAETRPPDGGCGGDTCG